MGQELADRPFLSVVVRTQGDRPDTLRDTLLCLAAQSSADFELLVLVHAGTEARLADVHLAVSDLPASLRERSFVLEVSSGGRATPLNIAASEARGRYLAVLDDDDLVLGHWVAVFSQVAAGHPGQVVRAVCVEQPVERVSPRGEPVPRAAGPTRLSYPESFDLVQHLERNHTPFMAYAFPVELFRSHGLLFDEGLDVCEDWDFALRAALAVGVCSVPEVTAVYRRWQGGDSSATLHTDDEWRAAERRILDRLDAQAHVFPPGSIRSIERVRAAVPRYEREVLELKLRNAELEEHALRMERSASWRITAPLRAATRLIRRRRT